MRRQPLASHLALAYGDFPTGLVGIVAVAAALFGTIVLILEAVG